MAKSSDRRSFAFPRQAVDESTSDAYESPTRQEAEAFGWALKVGQSSTYACRSVQPNSRVVPSQCTRRDLNPHALRRRNLNPLRLPIPPLVRVTVSIIAERLVSKRCAFVVALALQNHR